MKNKLGLLMMLTAMVQENNNMSNSNSNSTPTANKLTPLPKGTKLYQIRNNEVHETAFISYNKTTFNRNTDIIAISLKSAIKKALKNNLITQ